ncbi:MAG: hypothetical protein K0S80_4546 [Neobacillus sp.]|nr:hypothetical protein [Neobacillus sp.]
MTTSIRFMIFCSILFLTTSCVSQEQLEKLSIITAVGYDKNESDKIKGTTVIGQFHPSQKDVTEVTTSTALTSKMIRQKMNLETRNKMVSGQLRVVIFGSELAESGNLINIVDTMSRDPVIGTMVYLGFSETTAEDVLRIKPKQGNVGNFLYELFQQNINGELLLSCTLHEFLQNYYDPGRDPVIPYLTIENNKIKAKGTALISGDHFAGRLSENEGFYVKLLREKFKAGSIELKIPVDELPESIFMDKPKSDSVYINIDEIVSDSKIKVKDKMFPSFQIEIKLDIRLQEITEDIVLDPKSIATLEKQINKVMTKETEEVIKKLSELKSDPVGFGAIYNAKRGINLK